MVIEMAIASPNKQQPRKLIQLVILEVMCFLKVKKFRDYSTSDLPRNPLSLSPRKIAVKNQSGKKLKNVSQL
tara:strand:- start:416 stop:631 length:216 start_codon:yes stop_codon:yes gene_type:complete